MGLQFEWDSRKAAANLRKHGVSFDEASTAFQDPLARIFDDEDHSQGERREIIVGHSVTGRLLLVSFIERRDNVIRIISARRTTARERDDYEENRRQTNRRPWG
ncbi:MAG: BrnT family toxin [Thermodesulfobacteriota bacterium]